MPTFIMSFNWTDQGIRSIKHLGNFCTEPMWLMNAI